MSKKIFLLILFPALLLVAGYVGLQVYLRNGIQNDAKAQPKALSSTAGKSADNKNEPDTAAAAPDSLGGEKASPLDLRPLFIQRVKQLVKKSTNGLYDLSVGDLKLDITASTLSLSNVAMRPDSKAIAALKQSGLLPGDVFTITFKELLIEGVNLDDAVHSKNMDYKLVKLVNPVIEIDHLKKKEGKSGEDFSERFLKEMEKLSVDRLLVQGGSIVVHDKQKGTSQKLSGVQVHMANILLNDQTRKDKSRFLFAKKATLQFHDYSTKTKDGLYNFRIGDAFVDAGQRSVTLKNLSFRSPLSKDAFVRKQSVAKELYNLSIPTVTVTGIDWWTALNGEEIVAKEIETKGGSFSVYFDRALPPKNKMGNFPNQLLMKLPMKIDIGGVKLHNIDVSYEERNPVSQQSGTVYIDNASMNLSALRNGSGNKPPVVVKGTALLMHKVPVEATFRFDMNAYKEGAFSASVNASKAFDGTLLNPLTVPVGMMRIEKGELQKLKADMKGNENGAAGNVTVLYQDLKLSLLEKDKGKEKLDKKDVTSFLANLFVLKKENPKNGKTPRTEQANYKRDPTGGFMMVVWKTILVGVLKTIGAPEKIAYKKPK